MAKYKAYKATVSSNPKQDKEKSKQSEMDFEKKKYVAYYRVSTKKQGKSGLGLEAQQATIKEKVRQDDGEVIGEFVEVESGKKNNRAELRKAVDMCKATGAILIIAKLDRLSRDVEFIFHLKNSRVSFVCCDIPELTTLTLGIYASVAQHERERIVERIKDALKALKTRGKKLGKPENLTQKARENSKESRRRQARENEGNIRAASVAKDLFSQGYSYRDVAKKLNEYGLKTTRGKIFLVSSVQSLKRVFAL